MRYLSVGETTFEIEEKTAKELIEKDILYLCGEDHDLHLNPEHKWNLLSVEAVLLAVSGNEERK